MTLKERVRREIKAAAKTLQRRLGSSPDESEKAAIRESVAMLIALRNQPGRVTALQVANAIVTANEALLRAVGAVKMGPFDGYLSALESHLRDLDILSGAVHAGESLGSAALPKARRRKTRKRAAKAGARKARDSAPAGAVPEAAPAALPAAPPPPLISTVFADLRLDYQRLYDRCEVRPGNEGNVAYYLKRLRQGQPTYQLVEQQIRVPWVFVGIIHGMECGFNFAGHLHNGDPLTARTVQVPRGRPIAGNPPFTWLESALDALRLKKLDLVTDWSVPHMLYLLEGYNGFGYRRRGLPSPYLWSFSSNYEKGKFVADGHYDPEAVSKQCGAALMMKKVLVA